MSGSIGNPQVNQGVLNRARGNIQVSSFPQLNITAPYLGINGFTATRTGTATTFINTLTGRVPSPEPYQAVTLEVHLVKSQALASLWETQLLALSTIGNILFYTDAAQQPIYAFTNCGIDNVGPIVVNGTSVDYMLSISGTYIINNQLFALTI
jgi:hypothetical protein